MPYSPDFNYTPESFVDIMTRFMNGVNALFDTNFTYETFVGTGFYKYFYITAQNILTAENTFAEAYAKLQDFIRYTNETIAIPKTPRDGLIAAFQAAGYTLSIEPQTLDNAGILGACVEVDTSAGNYPDKKLEILTMLKDYTVAGLFYSGTERGAVRLSNGQNEEFAFWPPVRRPMYLRLTVTLSQNTSYIADSESKIKEKLLSNLKEFYRLGNNFEPEKYFTISRDAPYASAVLLEWKLQDTYSSTIYQAEFKDLFEFAPERTEVVIS